MKRSSSELEAALAQLDREHLRRARRTRKKSIAEREGTLADWTILRLTWQRRMLSISRIMLGLLFMEHGTAKVLDFPHQETHKTFALLTLNPGAQGLIELVRFLQTHEQRHEEIASWQLAAHDQAIRNFRNSLDGAVNLR